MTVSGFGVARADEGAPADLTKACPFLNEARFYDFTGKSISNLYACQGYLLAVQRTVDSMAMTEPNQYKSPYRQSHMPTPWPAIGVMGRLLVLGVFAVVVVRIAAMALHLG